MSNAEISDLKARIARMTRVVKDVRAHPKTSPMHLSKAELAAVIDHTLLKADATPAMIDKLCAEAREYHFASVCVNLCNVARCARALKGSGVLVACTVGFPLGATSTAVKAFETREALGDGAGEIDMVMNVGALKASQYDLVEKDIAAVVQVCHEREARCKVIIEAALLTDEEKIAACLLAVDAGADFCKTSTGFGPGGATVEDVALMRAVVGPDIGVKAAGGIRSYEAYLAMVRAGASRIGASSGVRIIGEAPA